LDLKLFFSEKNIIICTSKLRQEQVITMKKLYSGNYSIGSFKECPMEEVFLTKSTGDTKETFNA